MIVGRAILQLIVFGFLPLCVCSQEEEPQFFVDLGYRINMERIGTSGQSNLRTSGSYTRLHTYPLEIGNEAFVQVSAVQNRLHVSIQAGMSFWNESIVGEWHEESAKNVSTNSTVIENYKHAIIRYKGNSGYVHAAIMFGYNLLPKDARFSIVPMLGFSPDFKAFRTIDSASVATYSVTLTEYSDHYVLKEKNTISPTIDSYVQFDTEYHGKALTFFAPSLALKSTWRPSNLVWIQIETGARYGGNSRIVYDNYAQSRLSWYAQASLGIAF